MQETLSGVDSGIERHRPTPVKVMVVVWGLLAGMGLFDGIRSLIRAFADHGVASEQHESVSLLWPCSMIVSSVVLVASCRLMYRLQRRAMWMFLAYGLVAGAASLAQAFNSEVQYSMDAYANAATIALLLLGTLVYLVWMNKHRMLV